MRTSLTRQLAPSKDMDVDKVNPVDPLAKRRLELQEQEEVKETATDVNDPEKPVDMITDGTAPPVRTETVDENDRKKDKEERS